MTTPAPLPKPLSDYIRDVPDFPKPGILFKDITPLLADPAASAAVTAALAAALAPHRPEALLAIESRGFIFGAALAQQLALPLLLVRKPGKLPWHTAQITYQLEYGEDRLQIHTDAIVPGGRYAVVDDVLATGGTAAATAALVQQLGGEVIAFAFLMELTFLSGRQRLGQAAVDSLIRY